jgi:hypothetical protein
MKEIIEKLYKTKLIQINNYTIYIKSLNKTISI